MNGDALGLIDTFFGHIEAKNVDGVAGLYADDIAVWHNFSNAAQSKTENLAVLGGLTQAVEQIRYEVVERHLLAPDRVLQRHTLRCRTRDGSEFVIPACIFITVKDGSITRIDEYLDTAQSNALRAATGREPVSHPS